MKYLLPACLMVLLLTRCIGIPNYSNTPAITFRSINKTVIFNNVTKSFRDSLGIAIDYQDGDGDLGLDSVARRTGNYKGEYANNFIVSGFRKVSGQYVAFSSTANAGFSGSFPKLNESGKSRPIKGTINYGFSLEKPSPITAYKAGDTLRFDIYIYDLALNRSNTVTTDVVVLSK